MLDISDAGCPTWSTRVPLNGVATTTRMGICF